MAGTNEQRTIDEQGNAVEPMQGVAIEPSRALTHAEAVLRGQAIEGRVAAPGVQVVYEFGDVAPGLSIALASPDALKEPDLNARLMQPDAFKQLVDNVARWGRLESLPYVAIVHEPTGKKDGSTKPVARIVSGTKRVRAARAAGLGLFPVLLDEAPLSEGQRLAKQVAHNAIQGFDDTETLRQIVEAIADVDALVEAYAPAALVAPPDVTIEQVLAPSVQIEWRTLALAFLPHQLDDFKTLLRELEPGKAAMIGAAPLEAYDPFVRALAAYSQHVEVKNTGTALAQLTRLALAEIGHDQEQSREVAGDADAAPVERWRSLTPLLGRATVPEGAASVIKAAIDRMVLAGEVSPHARWQALEYWAAAYLAEAEAADGVVDTDALARVYDAANEQGYGDEQ